MSSEITNFWKNYYDKLFTDSNSWLDYSNERVQAQTFSFALEMAGPIANRRCLDAGCGKGGFSLALSALGASEVVGLDIVENAMVELSKKHPQVKWFAGSILDESTINKLGDFDLIFMLEVLQYVPFEKTVLAAWKRLNNDGRIIGIAPNLDCPIVKKAIHRFEGEYLAVSTSRIIKTMSELEQCETWGFGGLFFKNDQRLSPYQMSELAQDCKWQTPPNRIIFVAKKIQNDRLIQFHPPSKSFRKPFLPAARNASTSP